jgi:hypothetical protein
MTNACNVAIKGPGGYPPEVQVPSMNPEAAIEVEVVIVLRPGLTVTATVSVGGAIRWQEDLAHASGNLWSKPYPVEPNDLGKNHELDVIVKDAGSVCGSDSSTFRPIT